MIINSAYSVLSMLLIIAIGFFAGGTDFFKQYNCGTVITTYLKYIGIPIFMVYNVLSNFNSRRELMALFNAMPYSLLIVAFSFILGLLISWLLRIPPSRRGTYTNACGFSNTIFMGFPVIAAVFGDSILPTGMVFYAANMILFWTIGVYLLRVEGGKTGKFFTVSNFKQMLAPPLLGFLLGILLVAIQIRFPGFVLTTLKKVSDTTSPLGMMFIGSVIRMSLVKQSGMLRDLLFLLLTRLIFLPVVLFFITSALPVDIKSKQVFYLLALMPAMTQLGVMSHDSGGDYKFASIWITLSTVIGVGTIPLFTFIVEKYFV